MVRLKDHAGVDRIHHALLKLSLETSDGYVETFDRVDFLPNETSALIYSYRVIDDENNALGVLCLCFRFDNEMKGIFADLVAKEDWSVITLLNNEGSVIASSDTYHVPLGVKFAPVLDQEYRIQRFAGQEYLASSRCSIGYQGYVGPRWYAHVMLPLQHAFNRDASELLKSVP